jgi:hypothetical protein
MNTTPLALPHCCGLEWLPQNPQVPSLSLLSPTTPSPAHTRSPQVLVEGLTCGFNGTSTLLTSFSPWQSICPCKQWQIDVAGGCYNVSDWTVIQGECRNESCPLGFSLYPTGSTIDCVEPKMHYNTFTLFETACQGLFICPDVCVCVFTCSCVCVLVGVGGVKRVFRCVGVNLVLVRRLGLNSPSECLVPGCAECQVSVRKCTRCLMGLSLYSHELCMGTCPDRFFSVNGTCQRLFLGPFSSFSLSPFTPAFPPPFPPPPFSVLLPPCSH